MIIDRLSNLNASFYPSLFAAAGSSGLVSRLQAGFNYLQQTNLAAVPAGTVQIDGDRVFAMIQEYNTKPRAQGFWESHRKYIDIQYVVSGVEHMGYVNIAQVTNGAYDADKDLIVHEGSGSFILLPAGMFTLLFPNDVHMPQIAVDNPHPVKKVVVKVAVED
ncbi:MAG TPA: YhcH/YjgK/YiaL family protein [Caldilineaceae bacterium]|nr:YhcH/YjgK/YiaL family protein [Caldilineaceae bacterium]